MQGTLKIWIVLMLLAVVSAVVTGLSYPFVSRDTKRRLKNLEVEKGYKCDFVYRDQPIVEIIGRFNPRVNYVVIAVCLTVAFFVSLFSGLLSDACLQICGDNSLWHMVLISATAFIAGLICWILLFMCSYWLMLTKIFSLRDYYVRHRAVVRIKIFDKIPFASELLSSEQLQQLTIQNPR